VSKELLFIMIIR